MTDLASTWPPAGLPAPYYQDDAVTIYHGDCRDLLPLMPKVDLVLTDPPYGIGEDGGACRTRGVPGYSKYPQMGWDRDIPSPDTFRLVLAAAPHAVIWGGNYFTDRLPVSRGWLYWQKLMGGDFSDGELAWTSRDAALREWTQTNKSGGHQHPTQKPVELIRWCIGFFPAAQTILDPFMGSGTTLRAAKDLGRRAIGIEIEERYCEIAAKRMAQSVMAL